MPDVAITAPVAAGSIDRLALGATDARSAEHTVPSLFYPPGGFSGTCMAEE